MQKSNFNVKKTKGRKSVSVPSSDTSDTDTNQPAKGAPLAQVGTIPAGDLRKGSRVLYPGNKVAIVESAEMYAPVDVDSSAPIYLIVRFEGASNSGIAVLPDTQIYILKS